MNSALFFHFIFVGKCASEIKIAKHVKNSMLENYVNLG